MNGSLEELGTEIDHTFIVKNQAEVPVESLVADIDVITAVDGVMLNCVTEISVDGHPCEPIPSSVSCHNILRNPSIINTQGR